MTFYEMMAHCKKGGKARRKSWISDAVVFVEGLRLGTIMTVHDETITSPFTATIFDRAATDWEAV